MKEALVGGGEEEEEKEGVTKSGKKRGNNNNNSENIEALYERLNIILLEQFSNLRNDFAKMKNQWPHSRNDLILQLSLFRRSTTVLRNWLIDLSPTQTQNLKVSDTPSRCWPAELKSTWPT